MSKKVQHLLEYTGLRFSIAVLRLLGFKLSKRILGAAGVFAGTVLGIRYKVVKQGLDTVYPNMPEAKKRQLIKDIYRNTGYTIAEIYASAKSRQKIFANTLVSGLDNLKQAQAAGKGVIVATGHIGNWEFSGLFFSSIMPAAAIMKPQSNPYFNKYTEHQRQGGDLELIYMQKALRPILTALNKGKAVAFLTDQAARRSGILLNFLGAPASVFTGPARISLKTGAPVVVAYGVRLANGQHHITFNKPFFPNMLDTEQANVPCYTKLINSQLEQAINQYPQQWFWLHKRWKNPHQAQVTEISPSL